MIAAGLANGLLYACLNPYCNGCTSMINEAEQFFNEKLRSQSLL